ncbi:MAG: ATP-dependent DNA helicase RecG [Clostridiales bacterium GWF2_36_10]|nr:MAG: ATP-dependent DNA helicase RecG [Clostridiales bacterium GWF2_36_10]HAN22107.1 ATP-dependent DNA helicase RecG [Clostridiales bacterium]
MIRLQEDTPIRFLKGIGEARVAMFTSLGINTAGDLLYFFPRGYENRGAVSTIDTAPEGEVCSLIVTIDSPPQERMSKNGLSYTKATATDGTGSVELVFFNQRWIAKTLTVGRRFRIYGKIYHGLFGSNMSSPIIEAIYEGKQLQDIIPVYPLSKGLTQKILADAIKQVLPLCEVTENILSDEIINEYGLLNKGEAIRLMHIPTSTESLDKARRTLAFEELLIFRIALGAMKKRNTGLSAPKMDYKGTGIAKFFESLPFSLTIAQERVIKEIFNDLCLSTPMMRLVQGDVGSGKTILAAAAIFFTVKNGLQAAMMAPTEILANQHYKTLDKLLSPFGIKVTLLTGSIKQKDKEQIKKDITEGIIHVAVGTHALIQGDVVYKALGLAVTDEQHRFGVIQRASLVEKGEKEALRAHTLVMSATPIPRTLSLILYGDLEVSVLDVMPPGRQKIETYAVCEDYRERIYEFIKKQIALGHQAYIICPLVEENEDLPKKAVEEYAQILRNGAFKDIKVGFIHGRLSSKAKDKEMADFNSGESKVLVSTTVVEVGVDVPNATVMLIENAECFGLSQLHQLRGRIGRGKAKSYCILMSDSKSTKSKERLEIMAKTNDGFEIAEADLKQRGPGDFFGERQSGEITFKCADIANMELIAKTGEAAKKIIPLLENSDYINLRSAVTSFFKNTRDGKTFN